MGSHPINLTIRFLLELIMLGATGAWGFSLSTGPARFFWVLAVPMTAAVLWGTFAVPGDPSRSGGAPVPVPGLVRLSLEITLLGFAVWALFHLGYRSWGYVFGGIALLHYIVSYDRLAWLMGR